MSSRTSLDSSESSDSEKDELLMYISIIFFHCHIIIFAKFLNVLYLIYVINYIYMDR